jgi:hypothetical protein
MEPARSAIGKWGIVVGGIGLTLGAAVGVAGLVQARPGSYLAVEGREAMRLERHEGWGRRHGDHGAAGWSRFCNGEGAAHVNGLIGFLEGYLALGPGQAEAWQGLAEALRRGQASVEAACGSPAPPAENPAAAQLARAEALLAASLDVVRTIRPILAEFYASLTGAQRAALDALLAGYGRP